MIMEVSKIFNSNKLQIVGLLTLFVTLYSCGTYQSVYNGSNDGIYASGNQYDEDIVVVESEAEFDKTYFARQLEEMQNINQGDIITDIDSYYYDDVRYENDTIASNYGAPWEYSNTVVVNLNAGNNWYYNGWYSPFYDYNYYYYGYPYYGFNYYYNPWRYGYASYRYYNPFFGFNYGYYPYYYGFNNYHPYGGIYYSNSYFNRYDSYGKRTSYSANSRRSGIINNSSVLRRDNSTFQNNRSSTNSTIRRSNGSSTINRNNSTRNSTINRSNSGSIIRSSGSNGVIRSGSGVIRSSSSTRRNMSMNYTPSRIIEYNNANNSQGVGSIRPAVVRQTSTNNYSDRNNAVVRSNNYGTNVRSANFKSNKTSIKSSSNNSNNRSSGNSSRSSASSSERSESSRSVSRRN